MKILMEKLAILSVSFKHSSLTLLSHAENAGNHISELLNLKFFWGAYFQTPLETVAFGHLNSHSCLLLYGQTPTSNPIEGPAHAISHIVPSIWVNFFCQK